LVYTQATEPLLWSSDLAVLADIGAPLEVDPAALDCYLACGAIYSPLTMTAGVRRLPSAHTLTLGEAGQASVARYWQPPWGTAKRRPADTRVAVLRDLMIQAIEKRLDPEGPTAVLLSSGVDSSLLIAGARAWLDADMTGFTFRYTDYEGPNNEGPAARELAEYVGADFVELELGPEYVADHIGDMVAAYGEPFGYGLHTAKLGGVTERGFGVALSGMCTDDWWPSQKALWASRARKNAGFALPAIGRGLDMFGDDPPSVVRKGRTFHDLAALSVAEVFYESAVNTLVGNDDRAGLYRDSNVVGPLRQQTIDHMTALMDSVADEHPANQGVHIHWQYSHGDSYLRWNYHWGRVHGLAIEAPYTDAKLVEFLAGSLRPGPGKTEIRELAATIVPREMAFRGKHGQEIPLLEWFRGPLARRIRSELDPERVAEEGTFRPEVVSRYVDEHLSGAANHKWVLWGLWCYLTWYDLFVAPTKGS
jgi:asparagine synthase (glutamine-hydrolysing)